LIKYTIYFIKLNIKITQYDIWLTGQPGHGKTTLAKLFKEHLEVNYKHKKIMHIDGDDLRELF
jgi:adenylylsulfate kinase-like enzyme